MPAFEVHINGERVCVAALDRRGSVHVMADILHRPVHDPTTGKPIPDKLYPWHGVSISGMTIDKEDVPTMRTWAKRSLVVGDEIRIRLVDAETADAPTLLESSSADAEKENRRRWYEELKREFGG